MDKAELKKIFEENILYLQKTIPPDDIYIFCEQTFMAAMFFMIEFSKVQDLAERCNECEVTRKWAVNLIAFDEAKRNKTEMRLHLKMEEIDEDSD